MNADRLRTLVAQHAETSRLLGVDFVPAYRAGGEAATSPRESATSTEQGASMSTGTATAAATAAQPTQAAPPALFEVKPSRNGPETRRLSREDAQQAMDELLARYIADAPHKHFVTAHTNIVFGDGDPCADLMFVGEAPGEEEDRQGKPFVGRSGQLLDKMIVAMGLGRDRVYIANVLKTRPPNNATPTTEEARLCSPYLFEQIKIVSPRALVTLGLPATRLLLGTAEPMGKLRGRWHEFIDPAGRAVPVMPTYHPAYLLRNYTPEERGKVWSDLKQVMDRLGLGAGSGKPG